VIAKPLLQKEKAVSLPACPMKNPEAVARLPMHDKFLSHWDSNFGSIAKFLNDKLQEQNTDFFEWDEKCNGDFNKFKKLLISAHALDLPDINKQFDSYMYERQGIVSGVLMQVLFPLKGW
jgi:hypothetical protein